MWVAIGGFTAAAISGSAVVKVDRLTSAEATQIGGQARLVQRTH